MPSETITAINSFLRGPSELGFSSRELNWNGLAIERHMGKSREAPERISSCHLLAKWQGNPITCELQIGRLTRYQKFSGSVSLFPAGILPAGRCLDEFDVVFCALDTGLVDGIREEQEAQTMQGLQFLPVFHEPVAAQLLQLLAVEAQQGGPMGKLYVEHLAHALTLRILYHDAPRTAPSTTSPLPHHLLQRVVDRMHELNADLDLQTLAKETGYSRSHFLRMFHAATGCTPHCYLLKLRVDRAKNLLKKKQESLIDIAATCGFSSHAHMTKIFHQFLGITPSEYRRTCSTFLQV